MAIFKLSSILKKLERFGIFYCIFENNSLKALLGQNIKNWRFWNCRRILDIYRNWLLTVFRTSIIVFLVTFLVCGFLVGFSFYILRFY